MNDLQRVPVIVVHSRNKLLAHSDGIRFRASRRRRRDHLRARMQARARRHRLEAAGPALPVAAGAGHGSNRTHPALELGL